MFPIIALFAYASGKHANPVENNRNSKVNANLAHGIGKAFEGELRILAPVDHDNKMTAAQHHFVEPEILEVSAVERYTWRFHHQSARRSFNKGSA
jgi:hypothetical protein